MTSALIEGLRGGLIVSCQALEHEPLYGAEFMARMALAAVQGGAIGIRANTPVDIAAIRRTLPDVPIIGLYKADVPGYAVYITPTLYHAQAVAGAGADFIAIDATLRPRPEMPLADYIKAIKECTGKLVLADISTLEEGLEAERLGADMVSTTMSGYTDYSPAQEAPDLALVAELATRLHIPLIAEGRIATPEQATQALDAGAWAVIVGGAITRPQQITQRFSRALRHEHS